jgi:hypothetical protein
METKICTKCGNEKPATEENFPKRVGTLGGFGSWCRCCFREHDNKYMVDYYKTNKDEVKLKVRKWKEENEERYKKNGKLYTFNKKISVLSHYGGSCAVCGITDPAFLTIDHINNDGAKHRKQGIGGYRLYHWLIQNDFPSGFQVLCWNHNWLKHLEHNKETNKKDKRSESYRLYTNKIKKLVIDYYGGACTCCNETNIDTLTVDHIDGGGNKHRKEVGFGIAAWLKRNNFPLGFQVLCFNCNCGRHINSGVCPHCENKENVCERLHEICNVVASGVFSLDTRDATCNPSTDSRVVNSVLEHKQCL